MSLAVYLGEELGQYGFGDGHPFGPDRLTAFEREFDRRGLRERCQVMAPVMAGRDDLSRFHTAEYLDFVAARCATGTGYLDGGDTPALRGIDAACRYVVGSAVDAGRRIMKGEIGRAMLPIGGLHHAARGHAAGFCVFNDCGVLIEFLRAEHGLRKIAYVDIDAHHGDGVFYSFDSDPDLVFADTHEDGRFLYPGTGALEETGQGDAQGTKLNVPLPPGAEDALFFELWPKIEAFIEAAKPEFILLQCGADSLAGDPITHLRFTAAAHGHAAKQLAALADRCCAGRMIAMGGGGYNRDNLAAAWNTVVENML